MKLRCCNCGFVSEKSGVTRDQPKCAKCNSFALEELVPVSQAKAESAGARGGLLLEVPGRKDNLMG